MNIPSSLLFPWVCCLWSPSDITSLWDIFLFFTVSLVMKVSVKHMSHQRGFIIGTGVYHHVKQRSWNWRLPTAQLLSISTQLSLLTSVHSLLWSDKVMDPFHLEKKFHEGRIPPIYISPTEFPRPSISERHSIYRFSDEWINEGVCGSSLYHVII